MPNCPKCGAEMVRRKAKYGPYAGNEFYGCPNWKTSCKGVIINIDEAENDKNSPIDADKFSTQSKSSPNIKAEKKIAKTKDYSGRSLNIPAKILARPRREDYQTRFVESLALPYESLQSISKNNKLRSLALNNAKWRIDYPIESKFILENDLTSVLLIAQKILLRGNLTITSPFIENQLYDSFQSEFEFGNKIAVSKPYQKDCQLLDGSGIEETFYREILPKVLGPNYQSFVIPQLSIGSIVNAPKEESHLYSQRVDFYINNFNSVCVVEIDGAEHNSDKDYDSNRDSILMDSQITVIRITNEEVKIGAGPNLEKLYRLYENTELQITNEESNKYLVSLKYIHQIQVAILELFLRGQLDLLNANLIYLNDLGLVLEKDDLNKITNIALNDLKKLIKNLGIIYGHKIEPEVKFILLSTLSEEVIDDNPIITFNDDINTSSPVIYIQDITFHHQVAYEEQPIDPMWAKDTDADLLEYFLYYIFRHRNFNEGQHEAISRAMSGEDAIVLLPTGAGKSVAYQLTSMLTPGVMIVVAPLIALMDDQLDNLKKVGIDRVISISSQIGDYRNRERIYEGFEQAQFLFCYVAPERFQMPEFRLAIQAMKQCTPVSVIAVDEAHCVSEWGHDFRTAYLNIGSISRQFCSSRGFTPPLLALTGTASHSVLRDIQRELNIPDFEAIITPTTFDRKEISFRVTPAKSHEKFETLKSILLRAIPGYFNQNYNSFYAIRDSKTNCGIIFAPHVGGKKGVVKITDELKSNVGFDVKFYSGSAPKGYDLKSWNHIKQETANGFKNNDFSVLVATKAFGMGIDKPNIRYSIHYSLPHSVEQYYQEAGRTGRDRKNAISYLIYTINDEERTNRLLSPETSPEEVDEEIQATGWDDKDDIIDALWFHVNSFQGKDYEFKLYEDAKLKIGELTERKDISFIVSKANIQDISKVLHRLCVLGIATDYTLNYSRPEFQVYLSGISSDDILNNYLEYVGGYNRGRIPSEAKKLNGYLSKGKIEFINAAYKNLITFIYDTIERGRRRALREMVSLAELSSNMTNQSDSVRERILAYLQTSHSEEIEELLNDESNLNKLERLIIGETDEETGVLAGGIGSPMQAKEIRGQAGRYLESYPTSSSLLLLRGLSELRCPDVNFDRAAENIIAAFKYSDEWQLAKNYIYSVTIKILFQILAKNQKELALLLVKSYQSENNFELIKEIMKTKNISVEVMLLINTFVLSENFSKAHQITEK